MELALGIISFLGTVAGLVFKIWKQRQDVKKVEQERDQWKALAARATSENVTLRSLVAKKETQLAATQAALAARMSAGDLAGALNELFSGKPGAKSPGPAGDPLP